MKHKIQMLRPGDFVVFGLILVLAFAAAAPFFLNASDVVYVEISKDGQLIERHKLEEGYRDTRRIRTESGGENTVEIDGVRVRMLESDCRDQVCVETGWLTRAGQSAVCVPNRVVVRLTGRAVEIDAIVQ